MQHICLSNPKLYFLYYHILLEGGTVPGDEHAALLQRYCSTRKTELCSPPRLLARTPSVLSRQYISSNYTPAFLSESNRQEPWRECKRYGSPCRSPDGLYGCPAPGAASLLRRLRCAHRQRGYDGEQRFPCIGCTHFISLDSVLSTKQCKASTQLRSF